MTTYRTSNTNLLDNTVSHVFTWGNTATTETDMLY